MLWCSWQVRVAVNAVLLCTQTFGHSRDLEPGELPEEGSPEHDIFSGAMDWLGEATLDSFPGELRKPLG